MYDPDFWSKFNPMDWCYGDAVYNDPRRDVQVTFEEFCDNLLRREELEYELALARRQAIRALIDDLERSEKKGNISNDTYTILHDRLLARRTANDTRLAQMLEETPSLNAIELEMEAAQLRALEKQVYRDLEKEGDIDYESMESLVRDVADRGRDDEEEKEG